MKTMMLLFMITAALFGNSKSLALYERAKGVGLKSNPKSFKSLQYLMHERDITLSRPMVMLGKKLFFEKRLSKAENISCASCHKKEKGGADGLPTAIGHLNQENPKHLNTPTVYNTALSKHLFWDGRANSLEEQAKGPITAHFEMASSKELIEKRLNADPLYKEAFYHAFGSERISYERVLKAIASYERTLLTRSAFDQFLDGDLQALTTQEQKGLSLFIESGCVGCHRGQALGGLERRKFPLRHHRIWASLRGGVANEMIREYESFSKIDFFNDESQFLYLLLNLGEEKTQMLTEGIFKHVNENNSTMIINCQTCHDQKGKRYSSTLFPINNKGAFLGWEQRKYFRVPILRNITQTAPYMHNGSIEKLEDVIVLMGRHQLGREFKKEEVDALMAFFKTLEGTLIDEGSEY